MIATRLTPLPWTQVSIDGGFWGQRFETNRTVTLPTEFEMNKRTGALTAYQWEWDPNTSVPPWRIWVGDIAKWVEAASYTIGMTRDPVLLGMAEHAVEQIVRGQKPDGYLYANAIAPEQRWSNLRDQHEHYDLGHIIEAAVAYKDATGSDTLLRAVCRAADLLDANFGPEAGKRQGYDGHEEIELALVKLYRATGEARYLKLACFFLDQRGTLPYYFDEEARARGEDPYQSWVYTWRYQPAYGIFQAHQPVRDQHDAVGHCVRAMYLYSGMADAAADTGDESLLQACRRLWVSATHRRMYITGGIGSTPYGEAFTHDYDLPNETGYAETCAAIGLVFFAHRMLQLEVDAEYADVMERALYNGVMSGVSLDGTKFFYANYLTAYPPIGSKQDGHLAITRQEWFGCACCPPNIARLIASVGQYAYSQAEDGLFVHLYLNSRATTEIHGTAVHLRQTTNYPWTDTVTLAVDPTEPAEFTVALRLPGWCRDPRVTVNGEPAAPSLRRGYAYLTRRWQAGDTIELTLPMPVERVETHPCARMNAGKIALQRGPVIYCLEEVDNGANLADLILPRDAELTAEYRPDLFNGVVVLRGAAKRRSLEGWDDQLYRTIRSTMDDVPITAVPYCLWNNRGDGEMTVWIKEG